MLLISVSAITYPKACSTTLPQLALPVLPDGFDDLVRLRVRFVSRIWLS